MAPWSTKRPGAWESKWVWLGPDWKDINNPDTSSIGFMTGAAASDETKAALNQFIADLGSGKVNLFTGPLMYQDGSVFLIDGVSLTIAGGSIHGILGENGAGWIALALVIFGGWHPVKAALGAYLFFLFAGHGHLPPGVAPVRSGPGRFREIL